MPWSKAITHVIYDMDGLLLNTEGFYTQATQQIVKQYGRTYDWTLKSQLLGKTAADSAALLIQTLKLPLTPEEYLSKRDKILCDWFPQCAPLPGAKALTAHLHQHHIPQAVASSSSRNHFALKTSLHQTWFSTFQCVVLGDDAEIKQGKPSPEIFLTAAQRLKADPQHCLVFEDAPAGIQAALTAGMGVIAVPAPQIDRTFVQNAHQILSSLEEFVPEEWGLPAFPK